MSQITVPAEFLQMLGAKELEIQLLRAEIARLQAQLAQADPEPPLPVLQPVAVSQNGA